MQLRVASIIVLLLFGHVLDVRASEIATAECSFAVPGHGVVPLALRYRTQILEEIQSAFLAWTVDGVALRAPIEAIVWPETSDADRFAPIPLSRYTLCSLQC